MKRAKTQDVDSLRLSRLSGWQKLLVVQIYRGKFLNPFADIDLTLEKVAARIKLRDVHPVELSALMTVRGQMNP